MFNQKSLVFVSLWEESLCSSCWLGMICSSLLVFESLKLSTAGDGEDVNIFMMPLGNDRVMSPVIFTMHLLGSAPLK